MANVPKPITRKDMYYNYLIKGEGNIPKPLTRQEMYLYDLCVNGFGGSSDSKITPEQLKQIEVNAEAIAELQNNGVMMNELAAVATSGSYNDLENRPTSLPSKGIKYASLIKNSSSTPDIVLECTWSELEVGDLILIAAINTYNTGAYISLSAYPYITDSTGERRQLKCQCAYVSANSQSYRSTSIRSINLNCNARNLWTYVGEDATYSGGVFYSLNNIYLSISTTSSYAASSSSLFTGTGANALYSELNKSINNIAIKHVYRIECDAYEGAYKVDITSYFKSANVYLVYGKGKSSSASGEGVTDYVAARLLCYKESSWNENNGGAENSSWINVSIGSSGSTTRWSLSITAETADDYPSISLSVPKGSRSKVCIVALPFDYDYVL